MASVTIPVSRYGPSAQRKPCEQTVAMRTRTIRAMSPAGRRLRHLRPPDAIHQPPTVQAATMSSDGVSSGCCLEQRPAIRGIARQRALATTSLKPKSTATRPMDSSASGRWDRRPKERTLPSASGPGPSLRGAGASRRRRACRRSSPPPIAPSRRPEDARRTALALRDRGRRPPRRRRAGSAGAGPTHDAGRPGGSRSAATDPASRRRRQGVAGRAFARGEMLARKTRTLHHAPRQPPRQLPARPATQPSIEPIEPGRRGRSRRRQRHARATTPTPLTMSRAHAPGLAASRGPSLSGRDVARLTKTSMAATRSPASATPPNRAGIDRPSFLIGESDSNRTSK